MLQVQLWIADTLRGEQLRSLLRQPDEGVESGEQLGRERLDTRLGGFRNDRVGDLVRTPQYLLGDA